MATDIFGLPIQQRERDPVGLDNITGQAEPPPSLEMIEVSRDTNPDDAAKHQATSQRLQVPLEAVETNPQAYEDQERRRDLGQTLDAAPATQDFFSHLDNAKVAHDSVKEMSMLEAIGNSLTRGWLRVKGGLHQARAEGQRSDILDANRSYKEILEARGGEEGLDGVTSTDHMFAMMRFLETRDIEPDVEGFRKNQLAVGQIADERLKTPMSKTSTEFTQRVEEAAGFFGKLGAVASDPVGMSAFAAEVGIESLPSLVAAGLVTAATRNPTAGAAALGASSSATERYGSPEEFLREAGIDLTDPEQVDALLVNTTLYEQAQEYGFRRGAIIGAIDALSGGIAGKALAENPLANLAIQAAIQPTLAGTGEALAGLATKGEVDLTEVILEAVGEFGTTPIEVAAVGGQPLVRRVKETVDKARVEGAVEQLDQVADVMQNSPVAQRAPEAAADHLATVLENGGVTELYVSSDAINALENVDLEAIKDQLEIREELDGVSAFNGDVAVPAKAFAQYVLANEDVYSQLKDHVRVDPTGTTVAEAADIESETDVQVSQAEQDVLDQADEVSRDTTQPEPASSESNETAATLAEHELGVAAMFRTAEEGGFTEAQYKSYVAAVKQTRSEARKRLERAEARREEKRLDKQYQEAREGLRQEVEESLSQTPVYSAFLGVGVDRLDRQAVLDIFQGDEKMLARLPKQSKGRAIFTEKGQKGLDPYVHADLYGITGGADAMLFAMVDQPGFDQAVELEMTRRVEEEFPTLMSMREKVAAVKAALAEVDNYSQVLNTELNKVRAARQQKRLKRSLVIARARNIMRGYRITRIDPQTFETIQRRESRKAAKAIRAGDLDAAADHKYKQAISYEMYREAIKIRKELEKGNKFLKKIQKQRTTRGKQGGIPIEFLEQAQAILASFQFGRAPRRAKALQKALDEPNVIRMPGESLNAWKQRKLEEDGIVVDLGPTVLLEGNVGEHHWEFMTLDQWRDLKNSVKSIVEAGRDANKLRLEDEKLGIAEIVGEISEGIQKNISSISAREGDANVTERTDVARMETLANNILEATQKFGVNVAGILLNTDSVLRNIDGFESLGPAYRYIKGGIDRAYTEGYRKGQLGHMRRLKKESQALDKLFKRFTKKERDKMHREQHIPGVRQKLTRAEYIGVLLNMGNAGNIEAMIASEQFTEMELQAIVDNATKKELDFAQAVWDYFDTFTPEIKDAVRRRQNRNPDMVQAQALETPFGEYKGGYFPLKYDGEKAVLFEQGTTGVDIEEARDMMLRGGFAVGHTQDGHTISRQKSGGRPVKLDPFAINQHVSQVVYDLEMGDAVHDAFKVLHNRDLKKAFSDVGKPQIWEALDLWLGDVITGEIHRGQMLEKGLRHIRTGTTVSKLAFNVSTAMLQPLGLLQTSTQIGKANTVKGLYDLVKGGRPDKMYAWVTEQSGFMAERERSFNKDITDAQNGIQNGLLKRLAPGERGEKAVDFAGDMLFMLIAKAQRFVDVTTWLGAYHQGQQMFPNDKDKATLHADRMVARTQGSGNFHERTNFERGTISRSIRNTEMVRVWSLFLSYFAAKMNVAYERTAKVNLRKHPMEVINYPVDMVMLFAVEGVLAAIIKEGWDFEEEEPMKELGSMAMQEGFKGFTAGIPLAREFTSAVQGFSTGGAIGGFADAMSRASQVLAKDGEEGEFRDGWKTFKAVNNVMGILWKYPTTQVHKTGDAYWEDEPYSDIEWWHYLMGPPRD